MIRKREDNGKITINKQTVDKAPSQEELVLPVRRIVSPTIPFPRNKHFTTNVQTAPFAKSRHHALRHFVTIFAHESALNS